MSTFVFPSAGVLAALALSIAVSACTGGASDTGTVQVTPAATTSPAIEITDIKVGTGFSPRAGQTCIVHYTGWIYENGAKGKKFDSSLDRKKPFAFVLGDHKVIEGWERGVSTMKIGGKRSIIIPPALGYGATGSGSIPANATLIFEVELLDVKA